MKIKEKRKYREGVFIVTYRKTPKGIRYLILKRKLHWVGWEFPKGGLKSKENIRKTIKREIKEETGQLSLNIKKYDFSGKYNYEKELPDRDSIIGQTFSLYSVEIKDSKIKIDKKEHSDYKWTNFDEAMKKLTWSNQKKSLKVVDGFLKKISKFRNFTLPSGATLLLGKDAGNNDELVKNYKGKENVILHTAKPGSPFCIIGDLNPSKEDIKQSAIICAAHSQDWRDNKSDVKIHHFTGKDVKKTMKKGSWKLKSKPKVIKIKKLDIKKWS